VSVEVTLVVAATRAEAAHVPRHLPVVVTGIGKTAAAVATTRALAGMDPARTCVVNIGTAGALRDGLDGLRLPGAVLNHDMSAVVKHVSDSADASALDWPRLVDRSARVLGGWLEEHL
jgi:hypothetical protein